MDEVLEAFRAEADSLDAFLAGLAADEWTSPSACTGWSVADVVLHLAQSEEAVVASFDEGDASRPLVQALEDAAGAPDTPPRVPEGATADGAVDAVVAAAVAAERPDDPQQAFERWRRAHAAVLARFDATHPGRRLSWITVPLAARTLAATRLSEHWIHGMDVREPLGRPAADTDRLRHVARLAWRTLPYAFESAGEVAPRVRLHVTAPSGSTWTFGDDEADVVVEGPVGDWCRLAARRLRPADTALRAEGPRAGRVLELVRTYA